jgi:hypothetical protein
VTSLVVTVELMDATVWLQPPPFHGILHAVDV